MHPFDTLTKRQRLPVLRAIAVDVLRDAFAIEPARVRLLSLTYNTLFRVDRSGGPPVVLRTCGRERIHAPGVEAVEAAWLDAIASDLGWRVPQMIPAVDGRVVVEATHPAVPRVVPCSLFTWVGGRPLPDEPTRADAAALGSLLARLHGHAAELAANRSGPMDPVILTPSMASAIRADRVVSFGDEAAVAAYGTDSLCAEAIDRGRRFLDELWARSGRPHLLHGDFGPSNVLRRHRTLTPIDVQDLQLGHGVQDVGLTIADLVDDDVAPEGVAEFGRAYADATGVELAPDDLAAFAALRSLSMLGFCLRAPRPGLEPTMAQSLATVRRWMST